jgi:hypothetical protein
VTRSRKSVYGLLLTAVLAPLLVDLWLKWSLDQRADGFTARSATLTSLRELQADQRPRDRRPRLEVRVQLPGEPAPNERVLQLSADEGARYAQAHRVGDTVPVWVSSETMMVTPPLRLRPFEWFPFLHIPVALAALGLGVLARMVIKDAAQLLAPVPARRPQGARTRRARKKAG